MPGGANTDWGNAAAVDWTSTHTLSTSSIIAYMCIYKGQYYDIYLHNLITIRCWTPEEGDGDTHTYYIYIYIIGKLQNNYRHKYRHTWIDIWISIYIDIYIEKI